MTGTAVVDAALAPQGFDFSGAERWHVLVLFEGKPVARVDLPSPGAVSGDALFEAAIIRRADPELARAELVKRIGRRLGERRQPPPAPLRISVVVCTHRRSKYLSDVVASLGRLDPAPFEVIVVDNDPGDEDCREFVERVGFRYVREDRRGLDNARNAGLRAALGEVVIFTDDDVVVSPAWLAPLPRTFAHEGVAAVTGPAFPYLLDTPARVRAERQASLTRGIKRLVFDLRVASPLGAGAFGVGANMAFRRSRLLELGEDPFPPELDAGTETESGGDTYALAKLVAAGGQVVYEPEMFVFHQHRPDLPTLRKAVFGYGIGMSATLTKLLVEDTELTTPRPWSWLVKQYGRTQMRRSVGRATSLETRLAFDYLRGGFLGTRRWRTALRTQRAAALESPAPRRRPVPAGREESPPDRGPSIDCGKGAAGAPEVSVIVPTFRREETLRRCLAALADQDVDPSLFEVVVIDDEPEGRAERVASDAAAAHPFELRRLANPRKGAASARNHGAQSAKAPLLLFLDDDVLANPWLLGRHLRWHWENPEAGALVGSCRPRPTRVGLASHAASLWWQDFFGLLDEADAGTFVGALTGNMSISRSVLASVGSFSEDYGRARREDWEWGLRMRRAGFRIDFDNEASARHEFTLTTGDRLRHAHLEALGDTLIAAKYPEALSSLPLPSMRELTLRQPMRWVGYRLWGTQPVRRLTLGLLGILERLNLREAWARVFLLAQRTSYAQGAYEGGWDPTHPLAQASRPLDLDLLSEDPIAPPGVAAPAVRATLKNKEVGRAFPTEGVWAPAFAEQIVAGIRYPDLERIGVLGGWLGGGEDRRHESVEVIFGPASTSSDLEGVKALEESGAHVRVAEGERKKHWQAILAAAADGTRPLIAIALPGTKPRAGWLADALTALDGERVGLAFGSGLGDNEVPAPLYLHDAESADGSLTLVGAAPAYLVIRRELLPLARHEKGMVEPVMAAVDGALAAGWVIGHRSTRGLFPPLYTTAERGEAYARAEARRLDRLPGAERSRDLRQLLRRGILTFGWWTWTQRGRLYRGQRQLAGGIVRGAARGAFSARPTTSHALREKSPSIPRPKP